MTASTTSERSPGGHGQGVLLVFTAGLLWSTVGLGIRLIEDANVWQILFYRSASLSLFLAAVIRIRSRENPLALVRSGGVPVVVAALSLIVAFSSSIYALQNTSVAQAMLLFAASPILAALLGWLLIGERVRRTTAIACGIAFVGVAIMVSDKVDDGTMLGSLAALGSAFGFAMFTVALRWGKSEDMMPAVLLSGILSVFWAAAICLISGIPLVVSMQDGGVALAMGVFQLGVGLVLFTIGSRKVPAAELALIALAEVVLAPVWVWILLGETASPLTLIGGAVLLSAIIWNAASSR